MLLPFLFAVIFFALSSFFAIFGENTQGQDAVWIGEHTLSIIGFGSLGYWGWQYLRLRVKEEMLLVFVGMALFISVIVTFTFSAILLQNMEREAEMNLVSNVKVLEYTLERMKSEVFSNAEIFAQHEQLQKALRERDFALMEEISQKLMIGKSMDFLTLADKDGEVLLRAHSVTARGDSIAQELAGSKALEGRAYVTIEGTSAEKFSIRGAAPIYNEEQALLGAVLTGFIIDNAFADQLKKATALEATIYKEDQVQATTIFDKEGKTRNVGAKQTDTEVGRRVLQEGKGITVRTSILSRPYLAAYLPLKSAEGEIIGMLQTSRLQTELFETAAATNRLTLFVTIIIMIIMFMPTYFVAKKLSEEASPVRNL